HGIGPALSVTQMHAMLRMALRLGADLEAAFAQVNDQLAETLPADRFITAFIALLDPVTHRLRYISGGQGPILHFHAAQCRCTRHKPTSFPLGAMKLPAPRPAATLDFAPGDALVLLSDGFYECTDPAGVAFGEERVEQLVAEHRGESMSKLGAVLLDAVRTFTAGAAQEDDMTLVLVCREGA
ncbi:MAG: PP2C family protein-serine/threonine phosphatase, partial [Caldimonas sp.]